MHSANSCRSWPFWSLVRSSTAARRAWKCLSRSFPVALGWALLLGACSPPAAVRPLTPSQYQAALQACEDNAHGSMAAYLDCAEGVDRQLFQEP